jgi:hypothetical protein
MKTAETQVLEGLIRYCKLLSGCRRKDIAAAAAHEEKALRRRVARLAPLRKAA